MSTSSPEREPSVSHLPSLSNLNLQVALHYNVLFSVLFAIVIGACSIEKVPQLATYLLISLFPQLPFIIYLGYVQPVRFPVDPVLASFMIAFLVVQFCYGLSTVRAQIRSQTAQFMRLCEDENDDNLYDEARAAVHHKRS